MHRYDNLPTPTSMKISSLILILYLYFVSFSYSQLQIRSDCDSLPFLPFKGYLKSSVKGILTDAGKTAEIWGYDANNKYFMEQEHHTAWFKFMVPITGELVMNITPLIKTEDLDFLLFKSDDPNIQQLLLDKKIKPVRSNLSRGDSTILGITGLSSKGMHEYEKPGPGNAFSLPLNVVKGEILYLLVDNVRDIHGFSLELGIQNEINIEGVTIDENNVAVQADLTLTDQNGELILNQKTDKEGKFDINVKIWENTTNILTAEKDSCFFYTTEINTAEQKNHQFTELRFVLPHLKKGAKHEVGLINFYGDVAIPTKNSLTSLNALYKIMKKNPSLKIRIEGHVNDVEHIQPAAHCQRLSDDRCQTVFNFLVLKGIDPSRLDKLGLSCNYPLFPEPLNENHHRRNRRVEILVVDF